MEKVGLNITPKEFKQLSKWSENIYNTAVVIDYFVANQPEIEECYNLAPIIKHLRNDADVLNAFFIDHEKDIENLIKEKESLENSIARREKLLSNEGYVNNAPSNIVDAERQKLEEEKGKLEILISKIN